MLKISLQNWHKAENQLLVGRFECLGQLLAEVLSYSLDSEQDLSLALFLLGILQGFRLALQGPVE